MKKIFSLLAILFLLSTSLLNAASIDPKTLPETKRTIAGKYLSATEAYEMVTKNPDKVLFVDVRTQAETQYVGIADQVHVNIPSSLDDYSRWDSKKTRFQTNLNPSFVVNIAAALAERSLNSTDMIILVCRSGDRSASAANLLTNAGYTNVYSVYDGFEGDKSPEGRRTINGWKNSNLPWGYKLDQKRAYLPL